MSNRMSKRVSNLEQLIAAGLVDAQNKLTNPELETIEKLSDEEVKCLVKTAKTLGKKYLAKVRNPALKVY
jgi:hypothetical protein